MSRQMGHPSSVRTFLARILAFQVCLSMEGNLLVKKSRIDGKGLSIFGMRTVEGYWEIIILIYPTIFIKQELPNFLVLVKKYNEQGSGVRHAPWQKK